MPDNPEEPTKLSRREFLKKSLKVGAVAAGATALGLGVKELAKPTSEKQEETHLLMLSEQFDRVFNEIRKSEPITDDDYHYVHFETEDKNYILTSNKKGYRHLNVHDKRTDLNQDYSFLPGEVQKTARELKPKSSVPTITEQLPYTEELVVLTQRGIGEVTNELKTAYGNKIKAEVFTMPQRVPTINPTR